MTTPGSDVEVRATLEDELSRPLEDLRREVRRTGEDVQDAGRKANRGARGFDVMAGGVGRLARSAGKLALKGAAVGVAALGVAAVGAGVKLVGLAMDAAETASKFATVFSGVPGEVGGYLDDLSSRFGLVTKDLQDAAANFGVFGKAAGIPKEALGEFSKDLVGAGTDLASFYNADPTEVFQALRSGLSGEAEPLRQFGIFLSDATLKAEAATQGLSGELTESQKVMLRQQIIMRSLGDAEGDLERTSGGLANQWKKLRGNATNVATVLGTALLPAATKIVVALNDRLSPVVDKLTQQLPNLTAALADKDLEGVAEVLDNMAGNTGDLIDPIVRLGEVARSTWAAFQIGGLENAVGQFEAMTGGTGKLSGALELVQGVADDVATVVRDALAPAIGDVATAIDPSWLTPLGAARLALGFLADNAGVTRVALTGLVAVLTVAKVAALTKAAALGVMGAAATVNAVRIGLLTGATVANTGVTSLNTAARAQNTAAAVRSGAVAVASAAKTGILTAATVAGTAATAAGTAASKAAAAAAKVWAAGQWLLNAALTANPIGAVVLVIAALAGGIYLAYRRSESFRKAVQKVIDKVKELGRAVADSAVGRLVGGMFGDTTTSRATGPGNIGSTLAAHSSIAAATGARPTITNAFVGGGGKGAGSGDHQAGRALDLVGAGLGRYARETRARGGYAAYHGSGPTRHLHAVPAIGDTRQSMARRITTRTGEPAASTSTAPPVVIGPGAIVVQGLTPEEAAQAVADGIEAYVRDREERR